MGRVSKRLELFRESLEPIIEGIDVEGSDVVEPDEVSQWIDEKAKRFGSAIRRLNSKTQRWHSRSKPVNNEKVNFPTQPPATSPEELLAADKVLRDHSQNKT